MSAIRRADAAAPITAEEVAANLFKGIAEATPGGLPREDILPTFAKCMLAVKDPKTFLADKEYHLKPLPK